MDNNEVTIPFHEEVKQPSLEEEAKKYADAPDPDRPEWLPEKFATAEDLAKSYAELEAKLGGGKKDSKKQNEGSTEGNTQDDQDSDDDADDDNDGESDEDAAREAVEGAGLNFDDMSARYAETGELPEEDYTALEKAGIPRNLVDQFIEGQNAILDQRSREVKRTVGGSAKYDEMITWAAKNLSAKEIEAYDKIVNGSDLDATKLAVKGLHARYTGAVGSEPGRVVGGKPTAATDVYESTQQMIKDMQDPRYFDDPAFRRKVEEKVARSPNI